MPDRPHLAPFFGSPEWHECDAPVAVSDPLLSLHEIEQAVWRELHSLDGVKFTRLTVRRTQDGMICLQGIMEVDDEATTPDICEAVRRVAHVDQVFNQLLVRELAPCLPR